MYAVAFDLVVADTDIGAVLAEHVFRRVQGSLYVNPHRFVARGPRAENLGWLWLRNCSINAAESARWLPALSASA
jgi:virulence-associated protein VapD